MGDECQLQKREQFAITLRKQKKKQQLANLRKRFADTPSKETAFEMGSSFEPVWSQILDAFRTLKSKPLITKLKICLMRADCKSGDETWKAIEQALADNSQ